MRGLFCVYEQIYNAAGVSSALVTTVAGALFVFLPKAIEENHYQRKPVDKPLCKYLKKDCGLR